MSSSDINRKIAVILATDVVGYSKHMEKDEDATLASLNDCNKIIEPLIKKQKGRIFNTGGDSVFAEFPSAVAAVNTAVEFQKQIKARNDQDTTEVKLEYRIGINMGDVVKQGDANLMGDGVNIAARLEALAQPGGITISKNVFDLVVNKTKYEFNDLGIQKVKENQFHAYDLLLDPSQKRKLKTQSSSTKLIAMIGGAIAAVFVGLFFSGVFEKENKIDNDNAISTLSIPTILVYPFENLSNTDDTKGISPALTESMISSLSRYIGIRVLSGTTSQHAKKNNYSETQFRDEYNADYVIKGSIQTILNQSRLNLQLVDLSQNKVVWSDKNEFDLKDIFKVQDKIGNKILKHLQIKGVTGSTGSMFAEKYKNIENLTLGLNSRAEWRKFTIDGNKKFWEYTNQLKNNLGENNPVLHNSKAWGIYQNILLGLSQNKEQDVRELLKYADLDVLENKNPAAYALRALVEQSFISKDCDKSLVFINKAIELGGTVDAYTIAGTIYRKCNEFEKSINNYKNALNLAPNDNGFFITENLVASYYLAGKFEEIDRLVSPKVNLSDIKVSILGIYSFVLLDKNEKKEAKKILLKAIKKGFTRKTLVRLIGLNKVEIFVEKLKPLGSLD
jgi:TolB-like protein/class 3 adenylate cyclase